MKKTMKPILFKVLILLALPLSITSCVLGADMHGDWWNNDYATNDEQWVHPTLNKQAAKNVAVKCSDDALQKVLGVKSFSQLPNNKKDEIVNKMTSEQSKSSTILSEQCKLDKGFKFYPRGINNDHPTACFGELKNRPGCQSAR